jgi:hypothetical protein
MFIKTTTKMQLSIELKGNIGPEKVLVLRVWDDNGTTVHFVTSDLAEIQTLLLAKTRL